METYAYAAIEKENPCNALNILEVRVWDDSVQHCVTEDFFTERCKLNLRNDPT